VAKMGDLGIGGGRRHQPRDDRGDVLRYLVSRVRAKRKAGCRVRLPSPALKPSHGLLSGPYRLRIAEPAG
jgi:hypothetical protein